MYILQDAFGVIFRSDMQVFLHFLIPELRKFFHRHMIVENRFFHLITQYNMEAIRYLIRLGAHHTVLHAVDFTLKRFECHILKLWKQFSQFFIDRLPEIDISSENILIKARLALMHPHIAAAARHRIVVFRVDILFKNRMSALMNRRKHGAERLRLIVVVRHTHIL